MPDLTPERLAEIKKHAERDEEAVRDRADLLADRARVWQAGAGAMREAAAALTVRWLAAYPTDVFVEPLPGEHGQTVDACSARAVRVMARGMGDEIRALPVPPMPEER